MAFLITNSEKPLLMETIPVLKTTNYYGKAMRDNVYSYLRCYVLNGDLHCCFTCFDETPPLNARMSLCLKLLNESTANEAMIICSAGKHTGVCIKMQNGDNATVFSQYTPQCVTGGDEQGLFWGITTKIDSAFFEEAFGSAPTSGTTYLGNLFLHNPDEEAFASAFAVEKGEQALSQKGLETFMVVPY